MARIYPFQPLRYTSKAGPLENLVTQPYDKISPEMRERYLALSPYNLVRVILGERRPGDSDSDNVYTRAEGYLKEWIGAGVLAPDAAPAFFAYTQEFTDPDTGERLLRKGFIGLGELENYGAGVVYPHERTLAGPKQDRLELLRHTHTQCEQLFMLYPDPEGAIDKLLDAASGRSKPLAEITDEYGAIHCLWRMQETEEIRQLMADKKLLIADGHHRYETALAFRDQNPALDGARRVGMMFVNMHSPGLRILATHRLVSGIPAEGFPDEFLRASADDFQVAEIDSLDTLKRAWREAGDHTIIGAAIGNRLYRMEERDARGELDVRILHEFVLGKVLGIGEEAVRHETNLRYVRGLDRAVEEVRCGGAQIAFLLRPTSIRQVADTSFAGGVMPQKSTDFYPKLLSGLTIYRF